MFPFRKVQLIPGVGSLLIFSASAVFPFRKVQLIRWWKPRTDRPYWVSIPQGTINTRIGKTEAIFILRFHSARYN